MAQTAPTPRACPRQALERSAACRRRRRRRRRRRAGQGARGGARWRRGGACRGTGPPARSASGAAARRGRGPAGARRARSVCERAGEGGLCSQGAGAGYSTCYSKVQSTFPVHMLHRRPKHGARMLRCCFGGRADGRAGGVARRRPGCRARGACGRAERSAPTALASAYIPGIDFGILKLGCARAGAGGAVGAGAGAGAREECFHPSLMKRLGREANGTEDAMPPHPPPSLSY
jgi:hypothetical protein